MARGSQSSRRILLAIGVAIGGLSCSFAAAQEATTEATHPPLYLGDQMSDGLLQTTMREHGLGGSTLESYGIKLNGYAEAGFNFNFDRTPGSNNGFGHLFTDKSDDPMINQISLSIGRQVQVSGDQFDTGFKVQAIYGSDARYTQANGTNFYGSNFAGQRGFSFFQTTPPVFISGFTFPGQQRPDEQIDLLQAYFTLNLPFANGVVVKAGKFVTPWGIEKTDPTQNGLYSHSYIFSLSTPKTLTGVTVDYNIDDQWRVMGGVVVGWDQSLEDNNNFPSFVAQVGYKFDENLDATLSAIVGPEETDDRSDYRSLLDLTIDYTYDAATHLGVEALLGYEPDVGTTFIRPGAGFNKFQAVDGKDAMWTAAAGYVDYRVDEAGMFVTHVRGEVFSDGDGGELIATEVYSLTGGVSIRPFVNDPIGKNLIFRPEVRYDYSDQKIFDGNSRQAQIIFAADAMFTF